MCDWPNNHSNHYSDNRSRSGPHLNWHFDCQQQHRIFFNGNYLQCFVDWILFYSDHFNYFNPIHNNHNYSFCACCPCHINYFNLNHNNRSLCARCPYDHNYQQHNSRVFN